MFRSRRRRAAGRPSPETLWRLESASPLAALAALGALLSIPPSRGRRWLTETCSMKDVPYLRKYHHSKICNTRQRVSAGPAPPRPLTAASAPQPAAPSLRIAPQPRQGRDGTRTHGPAPPSPRTCQRLPARRAPRPAGRSGRLPVACRQFKFHPSSCRIRQIALKTWFTGGEKSRSCQQNPLFFLFLTQRTLHQTICFKGIYTCKERLFKLSLANSRSPGR